MNEAGKRLRQWVLSETGSAPEGPWSDHLDALILEVAAPRAATEPPLVERIAELEAALETAGDLVVGMGLPVGAEPVWGRDRAAFIDLVDRLIPHPQRPFLAALTPTSAPEPGS